MNRFQYPLRVGMGGGGPLSHLGARGEDMEGGQKKMGRSV